MAFVPSSRVYLLDTPLDNTYKNELRFTTHDAQYNYFMGRKKHTFEGVTYQRKNNVIRVDAHIDELWNVNYVMYQNTNFGEKWFYAFITKMDYVSDRATDITIETDVYQTWFFEFGIEECFVVREHVDDDTIGAHLVDEQLDIGEYKMASYEPVGQLGKTYYVMGVSDNSPLGSTELIGNVYGYVPTGLSYWLFENNSTGITWIKNTIKLYTDAGKADAIVMLFCVPKLIIQGWLDDADFSFNKPIPSGTFFGFHMFDEVKKLLDLDGYIPKNNKMHTYPYKFLYASNSNGLSATYRYEDFSDPVTMGFTIFSPLNPNPQIMLAPNDYRGEGLKYEYGLVLQGYPLGSWTTDTYAAWLASNGASMAVSLIGSTALLVGGIATGGLGLLAAGGGAVGVAQQLAQWHQAAIQPDQAKGQAGSGNLMFGTNALDFYFAHMTIKAEFAKRIDSFLTMYGYKVNTLKVPNVHSRQNWNYVQTIDANLTGAIPADDMVKLKKIFNDGITFWHNPATFLDYTQPNPII